MTPADMCPTRRIRAGLAALKSGERGFAIPSVMTVMVIGLGFSATALAVALTSQSGTSRDQNRKDALAVADAGAQRAIFTYNKIITTHESPCVVKTGSGSSANLAAGGISPTTTPFCGPVGGASDPDAKVGDGYFTYWVHPCVDAMQGGACDWGTTKRRIKVVSQGTQNGVSRRVSINASGIPGSLATGSAKAIGLEGFTMSGWSELEVPAATNRDFEMKKEGGCPGPGADGDGIADDNPLDPVNGCPRICPGDWNYDLEVSVGPPPYDMHTPSGTQGCNADQYRVNPPGPPESQVCSETFTTSGCLEPEHRTITLAPIELGTVATTNDNGRLGDCTTIWTNEAEYYAAVDWNDTHPPAQDIPLPPPNYQNQSGCQLDLANKETADGPGTVDWNSGTRTLTLDGTGDSGHRLSLNLGGQNYVLCRLVLEGDSRLYFTNTQAMPETTSVASKVFFDSPESCGLSSPAKQIDLQGSSSIESATWNPFNSQNIGLLPLFAMVGSTDRETSAEFHTGIWYFSEKMMLYAPETDIILDTWARENEGWFAGKTITMSAGAEIESPPELDPIGVGIASQDFIVFRQDSYVECGRPGSTIDANC